MERSQPKNWSNNSMRYFFLFCLFPLIGRAQFAPPVGQAGTTAMYKDSSAFINWASFCNVTKGLIDISNGSSGFPTIGDSSNAIGIADNSVVSLGDGGYAVCTFQYPITDGPGPDFAVFENSFSDDYLEFGFVEVSSDGINFFRFPATCNIQDSAQCGAFGLSDAAKVNNLGGKYRALYGTPFDLSDLQGTVGLDLNNVTHVKIIDVVGSISPTYATYDQNNRKVNDPWPTPFASSGFDLDAVGVIHDITNSIQEPLKMEFSIYPNPTNGAQEVVLQLKMGQGDPELHISDAFGREIRKEKIKNAKMHSYSVKEFSPGVYFFRMRTSVWKVVITQ